MALERIKEMISLIKKSEETSIRLKLEEYIPLKIICMEKEEPVNIISYSKNLKSLLEITVGLYSGLIKKITLLLCEEYVFLNQNLILNKKEVIDSKIKFNDFMPVKCKCFKTYLYTDGVRLVISDEKSVKLVKMGTLFIGISKKNEITEICMNQLNKKEIMHIENELSLQ